ncbi:MAG: hypothetical protein ACTSVZ_14340 [Promethearchaeota archaeon]
MSIMKIIKESDYFEARDKYAHLFDIGIPSKDMVEKDLGWFVRDEVNFGASMMIGDLLVKKHATYVLETHPFPEWVIQMHQIGKNSGKVYAIIPNFSSKQMKRLNRKNISARKEKTTQFFNELAPDDYLAVEYHEGISIKIEANVPHEFISLVKSDESTPYCQVFEPNLFPLSQKINFDVTTFYTLDYEIKL